MSVRLVGASPPAGWKCARRVSVRTAQISIDSPGRALGRSNQILAFLLAHLAAVEARGLHRSRACSSLYTYCIYELRVSEDAALRRAHAARILRRFPLIYEYIAAGELHLTAVLMLGPHLTEANHVEVLARAKYRTKKEVQALVRQLDPLPDVPACIEPLGRRSSLSNSSSGKWLASLGGPVRELPPGQRPKDWVEPDADEALAVEPDAGRGVGGNPRWRGRYVPAAVRRAVAERDCERCAYVDDDGRRCRETSALELHHLEPHARGGPPTVANLSLRCRAHNGLAAERDFGREFMAKMKQKETPCPTSAPSK